MNKTVIIILVVVVLLLCCCITACLGTWFFSSSGEWDWEDWDTLTSTTTSTTTEVVPPASTTTTPSVVEQSALLYSNAEYGFVLELSDGWEGYKVSSQEGSDLAGFVEYFDFSLPTNKGGYQNLFTIMVYTKSQWKDIEDTGVLDFSGEEKVGEDTAYVYSFSHINGDPPSELQPRMLDLEDIKESFYLE